ncbi:unnamed protein product [Rhizoctonia solani]|uniref:Lysine-specific metallo-endopeptidase domain-containing protein n=1 Tax=Rhizoctonia solani TaxID=456999 RepID=A0A8H2WJ66_9AGAM|nr:unnamed protein product [Rhizoctonia solani]
MLVTTAFILFTALLASADTSSSPRPIDQPAGVAKVTSTEAKIQGKLSSYPRGGYYGCSPRQEKELSRAIKEVQGYARSAYKDLKINPTGSPLYTRWFGSYQPSVYRSVLKSSTQLRTLPQGWRYECRQTCTPDKHSKRLAWINTKWPGLINLCPDFWDTTAQHSNLRAFTIIQEGTRFKEVSGTHKMEYGYHNSTELAKENPFAAGNNADNHAYFLLGAWSKKLEKGNPVIRWFDKLQAKNPKLRQAKAQPSKPKN